MERLIPALLLTAAALCAQPRLGDAPAIAVFEAKNNIPHPSVRIPALLATAKGTLIAVAEARDKATDQAGNDLVVSLSKDGGASWSRPFVAYEQGDDSCNNPCLVQDARNGRIFLFFQTFPAGGKEFGGLPAGPKDPKGNRLKVIASDDEGASWSRPADLSASLKPDNAVTCASGPGIGIQLRGGANAGRLLIPFNAQDPKRNFVNWVAYSDDGGRTWKRGEEVPQEGMQLNEVQVAETDDGTVYLNSRRWKGTGLRKVAWSSDGGRTWTKAADDPALPEPTCQGSLLAVTRNKAGALLFLNPAGKGRADGTLRRSDDGGRTWAESTLLFPGPFAYSSIACVSGGDLGVLYEPAGSTVVLFRKVTGLGLDAR